MRTQAERIAALHARVAIRTRRRERRETGLLAGAAALVTACLALVICGGSTVHQGGTAGVYSGATLLFEHAGAYILVALLAFMSGVAVTTVLIRRKKASDAGDASASPKSKEGSNETQRKEDVT